MDVRGRFELLTTPALRLLAVWLNTVWKIWQLSECNEW